MTIRTHLRTLTLGAALVVASVGAPALGASAEPTGTGTATSGTGGTVEHVDDHGTTTSTSTVPEGTRVGLFYCKNGEWKFGTIVLDHQSGGGVQGGSGVLVGTRAPVAAAGTLNAQP